MLAKHGVRDGWNLSVPCGVYECSPWRAIMKHHVKFMTGIGYEVGNGRKIRFWLDVWCGGRPLALEFLDMFVVAEDQNVCGLEVLFYGWSGSGLAPHF